MSILITGSTGKIGSRVATQLAQQGFAVRALTRSPEKAHFPEGVTPVKGDLLDADAMRLALQGVSTLFLLVPNDADELTQAINTLSLAREAGVKGIVYLSVTRSDQYTDVPHFTAKYAVERMIETLELPATILRPTYFIQNDLMLKGVLQGPGIYPSPVGEKGVSMVDIDDIADAAVIELIRRERAAGPLPLKLVELAGPDALTGSQIARIWTEVLGREVRYGGGDLDAFEKQMRAMAPAWKAYDMRAMFRRYQQDGAVASREQVDQLTALLGRPPRSYREFALAAAGSWKA
jgi:uncharacterized protein YbjT (DUF2867 family)